MPDWTTPVVSFDSTAVTAVSSAPQAGATVDLRRVFTDHAVQWIVVHDADDTWTLSLQGSFDGSNWFDLGATWGQGSPIGSSGTLTAEFVVSLKPARYVRASGYQHGNGGGTVTSLVVAR